MLQIITFEALTRAEIENEVNNAIIVMSQSSDSFKAVDVDLQKTNDGYFAVLKIRQ